MKFQSVQDLFSATAERLGGKAAINQGGTITTYRDLEAASNNLANFLIAGGAGRGTMVAILVDERRAVITSMLAVLKAGGVFVPIDPATPGRRLQMMIEEVAPGWIITERKTLRQLPAELVSAATRVICLDAPGGLAEAPFPLAPFVEKADVGRPAVASEPDDRAYVYFTSGSTGRPKGIVGRLKGIDHFIRWEIEALGLSEGCRVSQLTTPSFDAFLRDVFTPLCCGGTVCVPDSRETVLDARRLSDWLDLEEIELIHCVPSLFRSLLNAGLSASYFQSLRYILLSGEPLLSADVGRWMDVFGDRVQLVNLYGPTETTMTKFFYFVTAADRERRSIPIGKPMPGARALLLGPDGKACPPGLVGEIYIRTPFRTLGYLHQPDLTAQVFVQNPFNPDPMDVVYRTGDLGRALEDGNFEFLGRKDNQVKVRGVRVELGEIENQLLGHPAVSDVAVVDREDEAGVKSLYAYVVLQQEVGSSELREFLAAALPEALIPSMFIALDELPRTLTGKIDRRALPAPDAERSGFNTAFAAPRSLTEELLAGIWCELLGLQKVGIHNSFFEVGGHSLLATQLLSRIRSAFDVELPLNRLFETPTIARLAASIEEGRRQSDLPTSQPIRRMPRNGHPPLSFAQQRLWFLDRLEPGNPAYNIANALLLTGRLDIAVMARVINEIFRRHESLRTTFPTVDGRPVQLISPVVPVPLPIFDLTGIPEELRLRERERLAVQEAVRPFLLSRDPVLRVLLLRTGEEEHVLLLTMHHIVSDAWSSGLLLREWALLYNAFANGRPSPLPELEIQYADFALWQREWLEGDFKEVLLSFWRQHLAGMPPYLDLPTDRPRPSLPSFRGSVELLHLPRAVRDELAALGRSASTTLFMNLLTAFHILLARYAGQTDIVIGTPTASRSRVELEGLIGFFVNPLVLRVDLSGDPTVDEALRRVRHTVLESLAHQDLPFEMLVEDLRPVRDTSRAPLYQVAFGLQNVPSAKFEVANLNLRSLGHVGTAAKLDMDFNLGETLEGLGGSLEYATDLFDATTVRRMLRHFERLLDSLLKDSGRRVSELELLTDRERQQLLTEWNDTGGAVAEPLFHEVFASQAALRPESIAVRHGDRTLTYGELDRRSNQLARHLRGFGVGPEVLVGLCMQRSPEMVAGLLGILKSGAAYLPLDPSYPMERLALMMNEAETPVLVTDESAMDALPAHWAMVVPLDSGWETIDRESDAPLAGDAGPENTAYVIFTSGSTGKPKGVRVRHGGLRNLIAAQSVYDVRPDSRVLQFASLSFDASVFEFVQALSQGAELHLASREELMPGPGLLELLENSGITHVTFPPSALALLPPAELPHLSHLAVAGEACPAPLARLWGAGRRFFNAYGPTECTVWSSGELHAADGPRPAIGRPVLNTEILLLDRALEPVPMGVPGELYIGGPGLARDYLNRPDLTAERFIPHPLAAEPGARLYRTGDLARYRTDGSIDFLGRSDHQVKVRAFRIEPQEVEAALVEHPAVEEAVVSARGEGANRRLVAYLRSNPDLSPNVAELRGFLLEKLPEYMVPSVFVVLDAFPLRPNGKIDREALPEPDGGALVTEGLKVAPRNLLEEVLAGVWMEVLGIDQAGVYDNFFDLGGYSLAATQVLARVRDLFQVELSVADFFEAPTLAALGERVDRALAAGQQAQAPALEPAAKSELSPLSFAQEVLWGHEQKRPGSYAAHVPTALRLSGALDASALEWSLQEIVRRHEALRTTFQVVDGRPYQRVEPPSPMPLAVLDLTSFPEPERAAALAEMIAQEVRRLFDLARGPLVRYLLFRLGAEEHVLLMVGHHIVIDQWSAGVFSRELEALYNAAVQGEPSPLEELPLQYVDYAQWQRRWLSGEVLQGQLSYWRSKLNGAVPLELPIDRPRTDRRLGPSSVENLLLSPELTAALHALSRGQGATLFMTMLAAFKILLYSRTGQSDIALDFPVANRKRREIEPLIGFFPNMLVLRTDLGGDPSYLELLRRVQLVTMDAYTHQDLPFEILMEELTETSGLRADLLRVSCNFYNAPSDPIALHGLHLSAVDAGMATMSADLMLLLRESPEGFSCGLVYRTDLLSRETMAGMKTQLHQLLQAIVDDPDRPIAELIRGTERAREAEGWEGAESVANLVEAGGTRAL